MFNIQYIIERSFGYNKYTEKAVSLIAFLMYFTKIFTKIIKIKREKRIFISFGMPSYLLNISDVLEELSNKGYCIFAFAEWICENAEYNKELKKNQIKDVVIFDYPGASRILPLLSSNIFLSSVAGKKFYFPKKSKRVFYFHSVAGLDGFTPAGLDEFDYFLSSSPQQFEELMKRFDNLGMCNKIIYKAGYPKLDKLVDRVKTSRTNHKNTDQKTVLYAPTYVSSQIYQDVSIFENSIDIIDRLLKDNFKVIFRPHPVMIKHKIGKHIFEKAEFMFKDSDFSIDFALDYFDTYLRSDIMITDVSGTSVNFRLAFNKPVIFFVPSVTLAKKALSNIENLGRVITNIDNLPSVVKEELNFDSFANIDSQIVFNLGTSKDKFVQFITQLLNKDGQ